MSQPIVIVLDGHQRAALATTRALGKRGHRVIVAESDSHCLAASSKFCSQTLTYPDPAREPAAFVEWLQDLGKQHQGAVVLPLTDLTVPLVLRNPPQNLRSALPSLAAYERVSDKYSLFEHARNVGVRVPRTLTVSRATLRSGELDELRFPLVIKPRLSATRTDSGVLKRTVRYARSRDELLRVVDEMLVDEHDELLAQEYIKGFGEGVFALYDRGKPVFFFAHRRIREKPPSGGVSVLCESIHPRENAVRAARAILDPLDWHGAAMVEFKIDADGSPWLIEINARFWGSLQLAIDSGADFPTLVYQLAIGQTVSSPSRLLIGRQLRWLLGDLDNLYATLKHAEFAPALSDKIAAIARFCVPWRPGLRYELFRLSDPKPALFAFARYIDDLKK